VKDTSDSTTPGGDRESTEKSTASRPTLVAPGLVKPSLVGASPVAVAPSAEEKPQRSLRIRPYRFLGATVLGLLGLLAMAGIKSYRDLAAARDIENGLRREISEAGTRVRALAEHIERVENDAATLERIAREDLGMVRAGDIVIVLPEAEAARSQNATAQTLSRPSTLN